LKPGKPIRVYADTSVFGGVYDEEFSTASRTFFEQVRDGRFALVTSATVRGELESGPAMVRKLFDDVSRLATTAGVSDDVIRLRDSYLGTGIVSERYSDDALHVALASVSGCAALVSWNFQHIVHFERIPLYNAVNEVNGFQRIAICSPLEVISYEDEKQDV
jgi:predicted nucleic acid-binding protein